MVLAVGVNWVQLSFATHVISDYQVLLRGAVTVISHRSVLLAQTSRCASTGSSLRLTPRSVSFSRTWRASLSFPFIMYSLRREVANCPSVPQSRFPQISNSGATVCMNTMALQLEVQSKVHRQHTKDCRGILKKFFLSWDYNVVTLFASSLSSPSLNLPFVPSFLLFKIMTFLINNCCIITYMKMHIFYTCACVYTCLYICICTYKQKVFS